MDHEFLDPFGTPYVDPYPSTWLLALRSEVPLDNFVDRYAPYTTISQNRGGVA